MLCFVIFLLQACLVLRPLLCRRHIRLLLHSPLPSPSSMVSVVSVSPTPSPIPLALAFLPSTHPSSHPHSSAQSIFLRLYFLFSLFSFARFAAPSSLSSEDAHRTVIQFSFGNQSWLLRTLFFYSIRYRVERKKRSSTPPPLPREVQC